jgi:nicotinate phosphoribosyltransferase
MTQALHTDLYQLTMLASYFHQGLHDTPAVCEMFVRRLPMNRRFLIAAGLDQVLDYLQSLRFTDSDIQALRQIPALKRAMSYDFVEYLRAFRFTGEVWALPEGTAFFQNEPILRIEAPLGQAQLIETFLLSQVNFQTNIASKAARVVLAAKGRPVMEFGTRRTHGYAAVDVARAAYIAGFEGTSNVEAFERYEVPARGTMAHMYIMASSSEEEAFRAYSELFRDSTYLIDTYDTLRGTERALDVAGDGVSAIRIDSGDLADMSKQVRALLKDKGREDVKIVLSSDLDEYALELLDQQGSWDAAGVGTRLATCDDAPSLGGVYKLVQIGERMVAKFSENKVTYPGAHQVYRHTKGGRMVFDHLGMSKEMSFPFVDTTPLLEPFVVGGKVVRRDTIHEMRARCRAQLEMLPDEVRDIGDRSDVYASFYEVRPSDQLLDALEACRVATIGEAL